MMTDGSLALANSIQLISRFTAGTTFEAGKGRHPRDDSQISSESPAKYATPAGCHLAGD